VVRDDLFAGGTKKRALDAWVTNTSKNVLVYACDYNGHAAYALALTCLKVGKKVILFYHHPKKTTKVFLDTVSLPNVKYFIAKDALTQVDASKDAQLYARKNNALFIPIGLDFPEFQRHLIDTVSKANIKAPEIWCLGASGTLARSLEKAYPNTQIHVVNLGTSNANFEGIDMIYNAPEKWNEEAEIKPPYPSARCYDEKIWRFIVKYAKPGACIWNVA